MKISIVTPAIAPSSDLSLAHRSVCEQEFASWEHIIQCKEPSRETPLSIDYERAKVCYADDRGMYDALNKAVEKATGDIIGHLNSDEQYLSGTFEKVAQLFRDNPGKDVLFGGYIVADSAWRPVAFRAPVLPSYGYVACYGTECATCALFYRRRIFESGIRYSTQFRAISDAVWLMEVLKSKVSIMTTGDPFSVFKYGGRNLGSSSLAAEERKQLRDGYIAKSRIPPIAWRVLHQILRLERGFFRQHTMPQVFYQRADGSREVLHNRKLSWNYRSIVH